jgi:hypothetical protein
MEREEVTVLVERALADLHGQPLHDIGRCIDYPASHLDDLGPNTVSGQQDNSAFAH